MKEKLFVIIDTNIWVSYLIGKTLAELKKVIYNEKVQVIMTDKLFNEIKKTLAKKHLEKYFKEKTFSNFWSELENKTQSIEIVSEIDICRDKKDNYLLALAEKIHANYIITGDKDLLVLGKYKSCKIVRFRTFISLFKE